MIEEDTAHVDTDAQRTNAIPDLSETVSATTGQVKSRKPSKKKAGDNAPIIASPIATPLENLPAKADPLDLSRLRLSQDFRELAVTKALLTVPVRKPPKDCWFQTHPDKAYQVSTIVLEVKEENEIYLVDRDLWPELSQESTVCPKTLITTVNTVGVCFLWPIRLPGNDGRLDPWSRSALEAASLAKGQWIRMQSNRSLGAYEVSIAEFNKPPAWPTASFADLIKLAFKDRVIDSLDHPIIKHLRGRE